MPPSETAVPSPAAIQKAPRAPLAFLPSNLDEAWRISEMLSKSGILPDALKGRPHDILVTIMTGTELGLSPMAAIRDIYVVKGKGYMSALLKIALVKQSDECEYFRCVESTDKKAIFETKRRGEGVTRFEYTVEDAIRADLVGKSKKADAQKDNWEKDPRLMCRRRCGSQLADEVYSDIVRGIGNRDDVQQQEESLNRAPATFAPPAPEIEDAQTVPATPPPPTPKQVFEQAKTAEATGTPTPEVKTEPAPSEPPRQREPGDDDDVPFEQPNAKPTPPKNQQQTMPVEPDSDLAVFAKVKAMCHPDAPTTEAQLDEYSPTARKVQGPIRQEISDLFVAKRAQLRKAGGK